MYMELFFQCLTKINALLQVFRFFVLPSGKLSSVTAMEDVCKKTGVRDQQLDQEIPESNFVLFAEKFPHLLSVHQVGSTLNDNYTY